MAGTKRKQPATQSQPADKSKQLKQNDQQSVSKKHENVPIDEGFLSRIGGLSDIGVYVDKNADIIYDASLNQTNVGKNANKFYRLQIVQQGKSMFFTNYRWGRVGEFGQVQVLGPFELDEAVKGFEKKFKDKSGLKWEDRGSAPKKGKYTLIERSYEDGSDAESKTKKEEDHDEQDTISSDKKEVIKSSLPMSTQRLVELIFNESHFNSVLENIGYDNDKLPLGKLGENTLKKGFEHLKELASLIKYPSRAEDEYQISQEEAIEDFTNRYYSTIPHVFGRDRPPLIKDDYMLQREVAMLDTLSDMEIANNIMSITSEKSQDTSGISVVDQRFNQLGMDELMPLDSNSGEYQTLKDYLMNTAGHTHNISYEVHDIFRISRHGENERFMKSEFGNRQDTCRRLLWHGSRTTNYGGILSQGLRIAPPEAPVSGYAFGKGVYLADMSTKSANYCVSSLSGGHGLLLLCEAELGQPMYEILDSDPNAGEAAAKAKCIATKGIGRTVPQGWVDAELVNPNLKGCIMPDTTMQPDQQKEYPNAYLMYNEYICYDVAQIRMRYLFRVAM